MRISRRASRLNNKDIAPADVLVYLKVKLAVGEAFSKSSAHVAAKVLRNFFRQLRVCVSAKNFNAAGCAHKEVWSFGFRVSGSSWDAEWGGCQTRNSKPETRNLRADNDASTGKVLLSLPDGEFAVVKNARGQHGVGVAFDQNVGPNTRRKPSVARSRASSQVAGRSTPSSRTRGRSRRGPGARRSRRFRPGIGAKARPCPRGHTG